jgi:hypothetical protein
LRARSDSEREDELARRRAENPFSLRESLLNLYEEGEERGTIKCPINNGAVETTKIKASFFNIGIDTLGSFDDRAQPFKGLWNMKIENGAD